MQRYPLALSAWDSAEVEAACAQIRSGYTTMGEQTRAFEAEFARFHDCEFAVMVNSGSSANLLMIAALVYSERIGRGARVAVPAVAWSTTYAPLQQFGLQMHIVDIDETLNIDPAFIPDVDLIMGVNLLGNPMDFDRLPDGPILLEDNCESLGATYHGKMCGTFGDMASHSLFFSHHMSTMEGGMITTNNEEMWRMLLQLRAHGWTRDLPDWTNDGFQSAYDFRVPGFSVRPTEVQAVIGREQLKKLPALIEARQRNGDVYQTLFDGLVPTKGAEPTWFGFPFFVDDRAKVLEKVSKEFEVRPVVGGNVMRHPVAEYFYLSSYPENHIDPDQLPWAQAVHDCAFMIGNHHIDATKDLHRMAELLK